MADTQLIRSFLAIRDSFADQWQPQGGMASAMIEMLSIAYSLQMYWSGIAHERAMRIHDGQREALKHFEANGWKSPYYEQTTHLTGSKIREVNSLAASYGRLPDL